MVEQDNKTAPQQPTRKEDTKKSGLGDRLHGLMKAVGLVDDNSKQQQQESQPEALDHRVSVPELPKPTEVTPKLPGKKVQDPLPPADIWAYLEAYSAEKIWPIPSIMDRQHLVDDSKRQQIWDFFFPVGQFDIGQDLREQIARWQREIAEVDEAEHKKDLNKQEEKIKNNEQELNKLKNDLPVKTSMHNNQVRQREETIKNLEEKLQTNQNHCARIEKDMKIHLQNQSTWTEEDKNLAFQHEAALAEIDRRINDSTNLLNQERKNLTNLKSKHKDEQDRINENINVLKKNIEDAKAEIGASKRCHQEKIEALNKRVAALETGVADLEKQIPLPPSGDQFNAWLEADLEALERSCKRYVAAGTKLKPIPLYGAEGEEVGVGKNPIVFISPGVLQEPAEIPLPYAPPQFNVLQRASETLKLKIADRFAGKELPDRLHPIPISDRAKHLLARQYAMTSDGYKVYFGVYHIKYLMIMPNMTILYSLFFDFISGKTIGDKITEVYYQDIVAIEHGREYRLIPLNYDDKAEMLEVADLPFFSLLLPGGESRTVTFANHAYLASVVAELGSRQNELAVASQRFIDDSVTEAKQKADAAIGNLRQHLREHKGKRDL
jgi:hypothetical protein